MSMLKEGSYTAKALDFDFGETDKGTPFVKVRCQLTQGDDKDRIIPYTGYLSAKTQDRTLQSLRHMGWIGTEIDAEMAGLGTKECQIVVEHETYEDKQYARVKWVNAMSKGPSAARNSLDKDKLAELNAKLRDAISMNPADSTEKGSLEEATKIGWGAEDELPF